MSKTHYSEVDQLISELHTSIKIALGERLRGFYLFGSLVGGDFDSKTSDIDLLAIVESDVTDDELHDLKAMHEDFVQKHPAWHDRIEVAYVDVEAMRAFKTSTVRIARVSPGESLHYRDMDIQWLMDWYMVQEQGLTIEGPSPKTFIPTITEDEFVTSIKGEFSSWLGRAKEARWVGYQSYVILSLCRGLYAIRFGKQVSKFKGASWAAQEYPQWAELIQQATQWHGSSDKADSLAAQAETITFAQFMISQA